MTLKSAIVALAWLSSGATLAAAPDVDTLIARLARDAPATTAFTEVRFSHLLREPLIVSGELGYLGPRSLDRRVTTPYRETTAIRGDSVQIDREGERARSFALKHAPELQGFLDAFTALLAGDSAALKQTFEVVAFGEENDWALRLTPLEQGTRRRLRAIAIRGSGAEPQCFATLNAEDGGSVMLLGNRTAPTISAATSLDELLARCGTR